MVAPSLAQVEIRASLPRGCARRRFCLTSRPLLPLDARSTASNPNIPLPVEFPPAGEGLQWKVEQCSAGGRHTLALLTPVQQQPMGGPGEGSGAGSESGGRGKAGSSSAAAAAAAGRRALSESSTKSAAQQQTTHASEAPPAAALTTVGGGSTAGGGGPPPSGV